MNDIAAPDPTVPNHHANHPGFTGIKGWVAAWSMRAGRTEVAALATRLVGLSAGDRLVDIGCGPGVAARVAAGQGATVTGVDPAAVMLRTARRSDRGGAVTWREGTAEALPFADGTFDVAWSLSAVHHWPHLDAGLAEARRVLSAGGRFLAIERRTAPGAKGLASHGWTEQQADAFVARCLAAGFTSAERSEHPSARGQVHAVLAVVPG